MFQHTLKHPLGCDPVITRFSARVHGSGKAQTPAPKAASLKPLPFLIPEKTAIATHSNPSTSIFHSLAPHMHPPILCVSLYLSRKWKKKEKRGCKGASAGRISDKETKLRSGLGGVR